MSLCIETLQKKSYLFLDGRCDDLYNYEECLYDSGDCCRPIIQGDCDDCICHEDGKVKLKLGTYYTLHCTVMLFSIFKRHQQTLKLTGFLKNSS